MSGAQGPVLPLLRPDWPAHPRVRAACTLRGGGVSRPPYDSLNLALHVGDAAADVLENRRRLRAALALAHEPGWLEQVHGSAVVELAPQAASPQARSPRADAAVTREGGLACAIQVADCLPVLFAAQDGSCVGAAHAGWRGLAGGVLEACVRAMGGAAGAIDAWLGPAIGAAHFEVGEEVRSAFLAIDAQAQSAFEPNAAGRWQCDLQALARLRLASLGIRSVHGGRWCAFDERERFYSFRRDRRSGRNAALVWLD